MAVVALARRSPDRALVVGHARYLLVAVQGDERRMPDRNRLRAERQGLRHIGPVPDPAGDDEVDLVGEPDIFERSPRLRDRGHEGYPGLLGGDMRAGARR